MGKYTHMDKYTRKSMKLRSAKESKQEAWDAKREEIKEKQRRELGLVSAPTLGRINPKIESVLGGNRLDFHCPDDVSSDEWIRADEQEMEALPLLLLQALHQFATDLWQLTTDGGMGFTFRRMNKIMRIKFVLDKRQADFANHGKPWPTLQSRLTYLLDPPASAAVPTRLDLSSSAQVRHFLERVQGVKDAKDAPTVEIPRDDVELIVSMLTTHGALKPKLAVMALLEAVDEHRAMKNVSINVAVAIVCLLTAAASPLL